MVRGPAGQTCLVDDPKLRVDDDLDGAAEVGGHLGVQKERTILVVPELEG